MECLANTIACNMVGVLSFQFGRGGDHFHYRWLNIPGMRSDAHDEVAHKDNGSDAEATRINIEIKKWYTLLIADLGNRLAQFPKAVGKTALDNSWLVWGNEVATGPHRMRDMPIVFLGTAGGRLRRTGYVVEAGGQPHQVLGTTILNIMGVPAQG